MKITPEEARRILDAEELGEYEEIDSSIPHDNDWEHLGDDYYLSPDGRIAAPSGGDPWRTVVKLR